MLGGVTRVRLLLALALIASPLVAPAAAGRTVHLTCHDGDPEVVAKGVGAIPADQATCDPVADGVCAFTVRVPVGPCACITTACCQRPVSSEVPVRRKKRIRGRGFPSLVLRCLPPIPRACGFDPAQVAPGQGLDNLGDRARELDGWLLVHSSAGAGTTVEVLLPVAKLRSRAAQAAPAAPATEASAAPV